MVSRERTTFLLVISRHTRGLRCQLLAALQARDTFILAGYVSETICRTYKVLSQFGYRSCPTRLLSQYCSQMETRCTCTEAIVEASG